MPRQHDHLFSGIASFRALHEAAERALSGKRRKPGAASFMANREKELLCIERQLNDGTWHGGGYTVIEVREPKPRRVSAAPFRDRVVHHALCAVIAPIFERGFIADSYANRVGYGTHRAVARYEHYRNRYRYVLRADIFRYFPAIDHDILKADFRRRIVCEKTLRLMDTLVDGSNLQEPVNLFFPGDDLFTPYSRRRGLPIGNLTSQWFANIYLDGLDHYVKEVLRAPYLRYVDDFALFHDDPAMLIDWREKIARYLDGRRLVLHPKKTFISATVEDACFLGYVLCGNGVRRLPEDNVRRFRNRLRGLRDRWQAGAADEIKIKQRVSSWVAHAEHAQTWRLRHALFRGGWFDPAREPDGSPEARVLRGGSWNNKPANARTAHRNRNDATNRNNNTGFRPASTLSNAGAVASMDATGVHESIHEPS
ncbi:reverse transcriptase domain-containing protein [Propionivibrio sp.]|uniref:RNA-directed DNA polymerase n=1 Tax=Propionivibrio sp. TaxID=2212460 RepID=UPI003BF41029